jgi:hypothetical protein
MVTKLTEKDTLITRRHFVSTAIAAGACFGCSQLGVAQATTDLSNLPVCTELIMPDIQLASGFAYAENPKNRPVDPRIENAEAISLFEKKWHPNRRILEVDFVSQPSFIDKVIKYAKIWEEYMGLQFRFGRGEPKILIAFDPGGSWSFVGTDSIYYARNGRPSMNFGWFTDSTNDTEFQRTTLHEFGHALSLVHEHQHPTGNISWKKEAVYSYYQSFGWDKSKVDQNIFQKYSRSQVNGSNYNTSSIMHYPILSELVSNQKDVVDWNNELSDEDKDVVAFLYPKKTNAMLPQLG